MTQIIELTLDDFQKPPVLVVRHFSYVDGNEIGIIARCTDGSWTARVTKHCRTNRDLYLDGDGRGLTFEEKRRLVLEAADLDDEFPWVEYDAAGNEEPGTDCEEALDRWLDEELSIDEIIAAIGPRRSEHGVAFDILDALPKEEIEALGLYETDLGGPGSSVPAVAMTGSVARFNWAMRIHRLPFVLVREEP